MALTRRRFVRTAGIGAAGAVTGSWIGARGRENALWSLVEPTLQAIEPGVIVLASNENPVGPGATVLNAVKAAFGEGGRAPGRYSHDAGDLIDAVQSALQIDRAARLLAKELTELRASLTRRE